MPDRPPSQQGPEWDTLDKLDELATLIREGRQWRSPGPFWDQLPPEVGDVLQPNGYSITRLPMVNMAYPLELRSRAATSINRLHAADGRIADSPIFVPFLDLELADPSGWLIWTKRLYCGRPPLDPFPHGAPA